MEKQIKTTMRCHLRHIRVDIINNNNNNNKITNVGKDVEKLEPCTLLVGV
jgi:hypothetical protein